MHKNRKRCMNIKELGLTLLIMTAGLGCHTDMWIQPRLKPMHESNLFPGDQGSRPLPANTVAAGGLRENNEFFTGRSNGKLVDKFPMPISKKLLDTGQEKYNIFCSHCHGALGDGNGMITQRGLVLARKPPSYHTDRLRNMPVGHFYETITNGYGTMLGLAERVEPEDRWAISAYIRVLQMSQNGRLSDVPKEELTSLLKEVSTKSESQ